MSHIKSYVVVKGDNLTKIAKANNLDVKDLIAANKDIKNPNLILVGQEINIPGTETETLHITTGEAAAAAIKRQQELKSQEILNDQMEVSRQMEAERRNAGQVSEVAQQHLEDKIEKVTEPMRDESYLKQQEAMQNASDLKNQKIQDAQLETARQVEAERKNAGQVSETANAQIVDNIEETKVSEAIRDDSYQKQQEAIAEANAKQMKIESILAQQKFENASEEARQQSLDNASKLAENQSFHNKEQLDGLYAMLGGRDYSGKGKKHGECGRLARVQLELLGLAKPETSNSAGISYAKNLYFNRDTILEDGYAAIGRIRNEDPGKTFDELINTNFKAVAISFNSKGHYSGSGEFGHVIVVSGYNRLTNKVYVIDNYDAKWNKGTTPSEYDLKDFKEFYFGGGNSINYMTAIVPKTADIIASADENITGVDLISEDAEIYDANLVENEQMPIDETQKLEDQKIQDAQLAAAKQTEAERMNAGQVPEEAKAQLEAKLKENSPTVSNGPFTGASVALTMPIVGNTVQEKIWNACITAGMNEAQAAGVLANVDAESGGTFNPSAFNSSGGGQGAYGLCQWRGERQAKLNAYCASINVDRSDVDAQIRYMLSELTPGGNGIANYNLMSSDAEKFLNATDPQEAANSFCNAFERPGGSEHSARKQLGLEYYNMYSS